MPSDLQAGKRKQNLRVPHAIAQMIVAGADGHKWGFHLSDPTDRQRSDAAWVPVLREDFAVDVKHHQLAGMPRVMHEHDKKLIVAVPVNVSRIDAVDLKTVEDFFLPPIDALAVGDRVLPPEMPSLVKHENRTSQA